MSQVCEVAPLIRGRLQFARVVPSGSPSPGPSQALEKKLGAAVTGVEPAG